MCCYGCIIRSLYEMYEMAMPLAAALSQMNPVNTSSPIYLTFRSLTTYIYIYILVSYRSANLQTLHFKYLFNKYTY